MEEDFRNRLRGASPYPTRPKPSPVAEEPNIQSSAPKPAKKLPKRLILGIFIALLLIGVGIAGFLIYKSKNTGPVPASVAKQVNFPVYYPDQKKLPAGYTLSKTSFKSPQPGVVLYAVTYGSGKKLVFSVQKKPSDDELAAFVKNYIPIHREVLTLAGKATIGSISKQTVVSLPTDDGSWILITAPADAYGTEQLAQVIKSLVAN